MGTDETKSATRIINREPQFWQHLQVYPEAIAHSGAKDSYTTRAQSMLVALRFGNLAYICDRLNVTYDETGESPLTIAWRLLQGEHSQLLIYLCEFLRSRVNAVVDFFDHHVPESEVRRVEKAVADRASRRTESLKPLTKLLAIYELSPSHLEAIHFDHAWRKYDSYLEYEIKGDIPADAGKTLQGAIERLVVRLDAIKKGEAYSFFGAKQLQDGLDVFVLHRNYPAAVKPDHVHRFRVQHDYSRVVFGLNSKRSALILKVANKAISDVILDWVGDELSCELSPGEGLYSGYDANSVVDNFLGQYDEAHGIDLVTIDFRYTSLPGGSPVVVRSAEYARSIREELYWLRAQGVLRLTSLGDVNSLIVRFKGTESEIICKPEKGGAVMMHLQDAGLDDDHIEGLKEAFYKTFGIPLNQGVNPAMMIMGATEIYQYLLSGVDHAQVRTYQRDHLKRLMDWGLIQEVTAKVAKCTNVHCSSNGQQVEATKKDECPACQSPVKWEQHIRYVRDETRTVTTIRKILQRETGGKFLNETKNVESQKLHKLHLESHPGKIIYVFITSRMTQARIEILRRTTFPVVVIHPTGDQKAPAIDSSGIAHVGLPHVLAAREHKDSRERFRTSFEKVVRRLMQMEYERIMSASRHSRDLLADKPHDYDDRKFEADIYNIMRRLFPYTMKWGGGNKPDGFCSLIYFETTDLSAPLKFNVSYDAKYSESDYDFAIKEHRQMLDYIGSARTLRLLQTEGNHYDGHMIITNSMKESAMKHAAEYVWTQHRLPETLPNFQLIFVRESFLTQLWDLVQDDLAELSKRWVFFAAAVVSAIKSAERDGYHLLEEAEATEIVEFVRRQPVVESPINHELLYDELAYTLAKKAKGLGKKAS